MRTLIIPDVHQDLMFPSFALALEKDNYDKIIFLGDFFDSFFSPPRVYGVKDVCDWLLDLRLKYPVEILVGNHDISYYEDVFFAERNPYSSRHDKRFICSGYTRAKSHKIAKKLTPEFVRSCKIAVMEQGYVLSHAGFHPALCGKLTAEELVATVNNAWDRFPYAITSGDNWIYQVGQARGGAWGQYGGPMWLDYFEEFDPAHFPQIFGHTNNPSPRKMEDNYMLDAGQRVYGILENGKLTIKNVHDGAAQAAKSDEATY
jgi:predicted phosphodiesterase